MKTSGILALIGTVLVLVSIFAPALTMPIIGSASLMKLNFGVPFLATSVITLILTLVDKAKFTGIFGVINIGLLIIWYSGTMERIEQKMKHAHGFIKEMGSNVDVSWGPALLLVGSILMIVAMVVASKEEEMEE